MGTASTKKFIRNVSGALTEEAALLDTAGAGDANRIPALNASGVLDPGILNSLVVSAGAGDAAKIPRLDAAGRLDVSMMPTGLGPDTKSILSSEIIASGDFVNVWNSGGARVRKADATTPGKEAHGFVLAGVGNAVNATVYFEGANTSVTGQTPGPVFLSATAGLATATAPSTAGQIVQRIGFAVSATEINFQSQPPITLA